jgi:hypothetical protein
MLTKLNGKFQCRKQISSIENCLSLSLSLVFTHSVKQKGERERDRRESESSQPKRKQKRSDLGTSSRESYRNTLSEWKVKPKPSMHINTEYKKKESWF